MKHPALLKALPIAVASLVLGSSASAATLLTAQPGSGTVAAQVMPAALANARVGERADLLIAGKRYVLIVDKALAALDGLHVEGHIEGAPKNRVVLRIRPEGRVAGTLDLPGRPLRLGYADDGQWLLDVPADDISAAQVESGPQIFVARKPSGSHGTLGGPGVSSSGRNPTLADEKPAEVAYPVSVNLADLAGLESGAQAQISLPDSDLKITYEETLLSDTGTATWTGHLTDYGRDYRVILSYGPSGTTGSITTPSGEILVTGAGDRTWLVDTAASGLKPNSHGHDDCALQPPEGSGGVMAAGGTAAGATSSSTPGTGVAAAASASAANTVVDVLVLYTSGLVSRYGSDAHANTRIDHLIALANQAYANSGVTLTLRKVGSKLVSVADATSNTSTLSKLATGTGDFTAVPSLRNQLGADAVVLVRPFSMTAQGNNCGAGYVGGYGGRSITGSAALAFSVVSDGKDMAGTSYYCADYTFTHELGHNMGLMHDRPTVAQQGGGMGAFPYAYGFGQQGRFGTIMSYNFPQLGRFSNPLDNSCNGGPCGVAEADKANSANNAKALSLTKSGFSAFRSAIVPGQVSVSGIVTVDGRAVSSLAVFAGGTRCGVTASNGAYACTFAKGWTGTVSVSAASVAFTPSVRSFSNLQASASQNFAGVSTKVAIGGVITIDGKPAAGVAVSAPGAACTATASSGAYSCSVAKGWTGTISVNVPNVNFTPKTKSFSNVQAAMNQNFAGSRI